MFKQHWSTSSLSARMAVWTAGGLIGVPLGSKTTGWIHGWEHPMAFDVSWWIILAPLWCAGPILFMQELGKEIEKHREESPND